MTNRYKKALAFLDFLIICFYKNLAKYKQMLLLQFLFMKNPTQQDLDKFLSEWDIEVAGAKQALYLAYFMKKHPELEFSQYVKPRLEGVINFYRFKKIKNLELFSKIVKELNKADIFPVATGDVAIKCLNQNEVVENISLIIDKKDCKQVKQILKSLGVKFMQGKNAFVISTKEEFSFKIIFEYDFDVSYCNVENFVEKLLSGSERSELYDVELILPEMEEIAFIEIIELAKNIKNNQEFIPVLRSLFKLQFLFENNENLDKQKIINLAKQTNTTIQFMLVSKFLEDIMPEIIPNVFENDEKFENDLIEYHNMARFRKYYREQIRPESKYYNLFNLLLTLLGRVKMFFVVIWRFVKGLFDVVFGIFFDIIKFIYLQPRYFLFKILKGNKFLLNQYYKIKDRDDWDEVE